MALLRAENISVAYPTSKGLVHAVRGVSLDIQENETLGLVGESGSGKSTFGKALLQLTPKPTGKILFSDVDLNTLSSRQARVYRPRLQMVFQDPQSSLNPRKTIQQTLLAALSMLPEQLSRKEMCERVEAALEQVGLPKETAAKYPHEMSGGQRQRIGIARALIGSPELVVCDEAVSALDVSVQAQIINLLVKLRSETKLSYLFISHDLGVVKYISDRIAVMYHGRIVEIGRHDEIWNNPCHPYTQKLFAALPGRRPERSGIEADLGPAKSNPPSPNKSDCPGGVSNQHEDQSLSYRQLSATHYVASFDIT